MVFGGTEGLPSVTNALRAVKTGGDAELSVGASPPPGGGFDIYLSEDATLIDELVGVAPSTTSSRFTHTGVIGDGRTLYYRLRAVSECGIEGP